MTFFDFPYIPKGMYCTNEIAKTSFRVPTDVALDYWVKRFNRLKIEHTDIKEQFGKKTLSFVDFNDQQYQLISDYKYFKQMLEEVLLLNEINSEGTYYLFEGGEGGNGAPIIVEHNTTLQIARQGYGTAHHAAFRVMLDEWSKRLEEFGFQTSGYVDCYFFESLYARDAP